MENLKYVVEDKTIAQLLGVQNFNNKESAVLELVKNAYDANAKNLIISITKNKIALQSFFLLCKDAFSPSLAKANLPIPLEPANTRVFSSVPIL